MWQVSSLCIVTSDVIPFYVVVLWKNSRLIVCCFPIYIFLFLKCRKISCVFKIMFRNTLNLDKSVVVALKDYYTVRNFLATDNFWDFCSFFAKFQRKRAVTDFVITVKYIMVFQARIKYKMYFHDLWFLTLTFLDIQLRLWNI